MPLGALQVVRNNPSPPPASDTVRFVNGMSGSEVNVAEFASRSTAPVRVSGNGGGNTSGSPTRSLSVAPWTHVVPATAGTIPGVLDSRSVPKGDLRSPVSGSPALVGIEQASVSLSWGCSHRAVVPAKATRRQPRGCYVEPVLRSDFGPEEPATLSAPAAALVAEQDRVAVCCLLLVLETSDIQRPNRDPVLNPYEMTRGALA